MSGWCLGVLTFLAAASARGQVSYSFSFNTTGTGYGSKTSNRSSTGLGTLALTGGPGAHLATLGYSTILEIDQPKSTQFFIVSNDAYGDYIALLDSSPTPTGPTSRSGTAKVTYGTGALQGASGSMTYAFACLNNADHCAGGSGTGPFTYTLTASGTLNFAPGNFKPGSPGLPPSLIPCGQSPGYSVAQEGAGSGAILVANEGGAGTGNVVNQPEGIANPSVRAVPNADGGGGIGICPADGGGGVSIVNQPAGTLPEARAATATTPSFQPVGLSLPWQTQPVNYSATATCANLTGTCWVTLPSPTGTLAAFSSATLEADVSASGLAPGVYTASIALTLTPTGGSTDVTHVNNIPVTLVVGNGTPIVRISETAIAFQSVAGIAQSGLTHAVSLGSSSTTVPYTATASTLSGGSWLSVNPATGSITSTAASVVNISANPTGLAAGSYFGRVDVSASGALNPSQSIPVQLTVAAAPSATPTLSTTGLTFTTVQNGTPSAQTFTLSTNSTAPLSISIGTAAQNLASWLKATASATTLVAGKPITITVSINTAQLPPGMYTGQVVAQDTNTLVQYPVQVALIVTAAGTCTPARLVPVLTSLSNGFEQPAAFPATLTAKVVDDCGNPLTAGAVQASFGNGDAPVSLASIGNGIWTGTWLPQETTASQVAVALFAYFSFGDGTGLSGFTTVQGTLDANPAAVLVSTGGIVNAASLVSEAPVAPGEFLSVFGTNLATGAAPAKSVPYATSLNSTQVLLGGHPPLRQEPR